MTYMYNIGKKSYLWRFLWYTGLGRFTTSFMSKAFRTRDVALVQTCRQGIINTAIKIENNSIRLQEFKQYLILCEKHNTTNTSSNAYNTNTTPSTNAHTTIKPFIQSKSDITMEDIAIASLYAAIINPAQYCNSQYYTSFHMLEQQDKEYAAEVEFFRASVVGQFSMYMYNNFRL